jgi:5-methylcytosine-specific restriction enzyme A
MGLLYHWTRQNYLRDLDQGVAYHFNQSNPLLHEIEVGESLWAFTRASGGNYVLAAELVITARTQNPPNFHYGRYRVWGDLKTSRYFKTEGQPAVETQIRSLSCKAKASTLGQAFQGHAAVRRLTLEDHHLLSEFARDLPLEPRAKLLPEESLEAAISRDSSEEVSRLIVKEAPGIAKQRRDYLLKRATVRNRELVLQLKEIYNGACQLTGWDPRKEYGVDLCEAHHIQWLSRGGADDLRNMILLCPNLHNAIHACDSALDFGDGSFVFGSLRQQVVLNRHLEFRDV